MQRIAFSPVLRSASTLLVAACSPASSATSSLIDNMASASPSLITPPSWRLQTSVIIRPRSSRSRRGLYDGKDVRFGNNVPFSMKKTRRRWNPNVQRKRLYSDVLDEMIKFHVTTSALRSIDKMGGLDNYLLKSKHVTTEGEGGRVKNRIIQKMKHGEELKKQAVARGESVEDWDRIILVGKKIKQPSSFDPLEEE